MTARTVLIVGGSVCTVCAFALVQHQVMGLLPALRTMVVPVVVGALVGFVLAAVVELRRRVQRLNRTLEESLHHTSLQLSATRDELVRLGRERMVGLLAAGVAHDLNNLFTVTSSVLSLRSPSREDVDAALEALVRAGELARRLTELGRPHRAAARLDLAARVRSIEPLVARVLKPGAKLEWGVGQKVEVSVDGVDVDQLVLNLVLNASGALPEGGGRISVRVACVDAQARLVVEDTGVGMTDEVRQRVFEPFFTRRADGRGTGLGMAVVRDVVDRAQGNIDVQSTPGKGTCFTVVFPLAPPATATTRLASSDSR